MNSTLLPYWSIALTAALVSVAVVTDLRWRRIPNSLTFPATAVAIGFRIAFQGWAGLGLAVAGALVAPTLLLLMHRGRGLGMGDLKLAMAIGAIFGPLLGAVTMLVSALAGGIMALTILTANGRGLVQVLDVLLIGVPFAKKFRSDALEAGNTPAATGFTMPYGVALAVGSLITLAACWWTGQETWFLSFVGIAGSL